MRNYTFQVLEPEDWQIETGVPEMDQAMKEYGATEANLLKALLSMAENIQEAGPEGLSPSEIANQAARDFGLVYRCLKHHHRAAVLHDKVLSPGYTGS